MTFGVKRGFDEGSVEFGASIGRASAGTDETSISDITSGLVIEGLVSELGPLWPGRGSRDVGGDDGIVGRTSSGGAAVLKSDSASEESVRPGA